MTVKNGRSGKMGGTSTALYEKITLWDGMYLHAQRNSHIFLKIFLLFLKKGKLI